MSGPWQDRRFGTSLTSPYSRPELRGPLPLSGQELDELVRLIASRDERIPPDALRALVNVESTDNPYAVSRDKEGNPIARGLAQLTPIALEQIKRDPETFDYFDPYENLSASGEYLSYCLTETGGDWEEALRCYNQGPGHESPDGDDYIRKNLETRPNYDSAFGEMNPFALAPVDLESEPLAPDAGTLRPSSTWEKIAGAITPDGGVTEKLLTNPLTTARELFVPQDVERDPERVINYPPKNPNDPSLDMQGNPWRGLSFYVEGWDELPASPPPRPQPLWSPAPGDKDTARFQSRYPRSRDIDYDPDDVYLNLVGRTSVPDRPMPTEREILDIANEVERIREFGEKRSGGLAFGTSLGGIPNTVRGMANPLKMGLKVMSGPMALAQGVGGAASELMAQGELPSVFRTPRGHTIRLIEAPSDGFFGVGQGLLPPVEGNPRATAHIWDDLWAATVAGTEEIVGESLGNLLGKGLRGAGKTLKQIGERPAQRVIEKIIRGKDHLFRREKFEGEKLAFRDFWDMVASFGSRSIKTGRADFRPFMGAMPLWRSIVRKTDPGTATQTNVGLKEVSPEVSNPRARTALEELTLKSRDMADAMIKPFHEITVDRGGEKGWLSRLMGTEWWKDYKLLRRMKALPEGDHERIAAQIDAMQGLMAVPHRSVQGASDVVEIQTLRHLPISELNDLRRMAGDMAQSVYDVRSDAAIKAGREMSKEEMIQPQFWAQVRDLAQEDIVRVLQKPRVVDGVKMGGHDLAAQWIQQNLRTEAAGALAAIANNSRSWALRSAMFALPGFAYYATPEEYRMAIMLASMGMMAPQVQSIMGRGMVGLGASRYPVWQNIPRAWNVATDEPRTEPAPGQ